MSEVLYLDTSVVLRAVLEGGLSAEMQRAVGDAKHLVTSRLSLVESARALHRLRGGSLTERAITDATHEIDAVWARCTIWELTPAVCRLAGEIAPARRLRLLDALHLATFLHIRRRLGPVVELLTADDRLADAATWA